ncbi:hypothetical protein ACPPVS_09940 [Cellulomonas sp. McL0617]|uniref:hypothetical protein n=1 Tax=Cellulomonas sp. McL0617 TaxID=3415675 RepID=UPI003CFBA86D
MSGVREDAVGVARPTVPPATAATAMAALSLLVVSFARWGPDWPAQEFRAELARSSAFLVWNDNWYAGHALPGYSVLYPLLAHELGAAGTGVVATVLAAVVAPRLLRVGVAPARRGLFEAAVVAMLTVALVIGQIPFLLGVAFGVSAVVAVRSVPGRLGWGLAAALSLACSLASPLAGALLLLVAAGLSADRSWRRLTALIPAVGGVAVAVAVGGAGGPMPFPWISLVCVLAFCAVVWAVVPVQMVALRAFTVRFVPLYAVAAVACFVIPNPVGGNIARLSQVMALPAAAAVASRHTPRRLVGSLVVLGLAVAWTAQPAEGSVFGERPASGLASYYSGLMSYLATQPSTGRLEIPFTRGHWEVSYVAPDYPLARGWERQTDLADNAVLYDTLTSTRYARWLRDNAVSLVALPDVPLDTGGLAEAAILKHPPAYLHLVWQDAHWKVWSVEGTPPLATGAGHLIHLGTQEFTLDVTRPGSTLVRIHASRLWKVVSGDACIEETRSGWLTVRVDRPQVVVAAASLDALLPGTNVEECGD